MNVTAKEKSTGLEGSIIISNDRNRLTKEEIDRMVADAERYRLDELKHRERTSAKSALESFCLSIKQNVEKQKDVVVKKCTDIINWLDKDEPADKKDFEEKKKEVEDLMNGIPQLVASSTAAAIESRSTPKRRSETSPGGSKEKDSMSNKRAKK